MSARRFNFLPPGTSLGWTPYAWLVYLLTFFITPILVTRAGTAPWWMWPLTIAATLIFLAAYFVGYWVQGRRLMATAAIQTALGVAFSPINPGACVFFVYAAGCVGTLEPSRLASRGLIIIAAIGTATALLTNAPPFFYVVATIITLMVGGVNLHFAQENRAQSRLRLAHAEVEQLAAIAERERIARDLHDVLGHTLLLIVLKAELAVKLADVDADRAVREMRDVEDVARRTLQEVRHAIRGYRTTLREEIERSRSLLKAARVTADIDMQALILPQAVEETLALCVREAVTNVVRHAEAACCSIRVTASSDSVVLEVSDDGRGISAQAGLGLRGMHERVEAMGGTMSMAGSPGTRVTVALPLDRTVDPARSAPAAARAVDRAEALSGPAHR